MEVVEDPRAEPAKTNIGGELGEMARMELVDGLELDDDPLSHDIRPEGPLQATTIVVE